MSAPTLYIALTYHGFGHVAQTAPVVNRMASQQRDLRVVIESEAPEELLRRHFHMPFERVDASSDFGMVMHDSLVVDVEASHARYLEQLRRWRVDIELSMQRMQRFNPALVLGNVPYIPLVAAQRLGVTAVALCSLNWAEIYLGYCRGLPGAEEVYGQLSAAYGGVERFINPTPCMPMPGVSNLQLVGPIARRGVSRRAQIASQLKLRDGTRLVAVFMGGVHTDLPLAAWPRHADIHWLISGSDCPPREDMTPVTALPYSYIDVLCSSDALITKPGYGAFAESACNGIPVLYVPRGSWPEEPHLTDWMQNNARCLPLDRSALDSGELRPSLDALWSQSARAPVAPTGINESADALLSMME